MNLKTNRRERRKALTGLCLRSSDVGLLQKPLTPLLILCWIFLATILGFLRLEIDLL